MTRTDLTNWITGTLLCWALVAMALLLGSRP